MVEKTKKAHDEDGVVSSSETLTLLDPVSLVRMTVPVRASTCVHNACFDLVTHLEYNRVRPTWKCPHCNGDASFHALYVDEFVANMLQKIPSDAETQQVLLDTTDGTYRPLKESEIDKGYKSYRSDSDREEAGDKPKAPAQVVFEISDDDDDW